MDEWLPRAVGRRLAVVVFGSMNRPRRVSDPETWPLPCPDGLPGAPGRSASIHRDRPHSCQPARGLGVVPGDVV